MDNFLIIYEILKYIEDSMHRGIFDEDNFNARTFGTSDAFFHHVLQALLDDGYIKGISCKVVGDTYIVAPIQPRLTIQGMEYLADNTMMKKAYKILKGIKDVVPMI